MKLSLSLLLSLVAASSADPSDERFLQTGLVVPINLPVCQTTNCSPNTYCTEPSPNFAVCKADVCRDVKCPGADQVCVGKDIESDNPTTKCIDDPCKTIFAEQTCPDACRVNDIEEAAYCQGVGKIEEPVNPECPTGKVYNDCGSACPPSCDTIGAEPIFCTLQCVQGCFCATGTVETADGNCVAPDDCPTTVTPIGITCANVRCASDTICLEFPTGPQCVAGGFDSWFDTVKENYTGESRLRKCKKRQAGGSRPAPADGDNCSKRKKTCFFGNQVCGGAPYPDMQCDCVNGKWTCDETLACPVV